MSTVRDFWSGLGLLDWLGVPASVAVQITTNQSNSSHIEKRMAVLQYYHQTVPGASWGRIAGVLWYLQEQTALKTVRQYLPHKPGEYITVLVVFSTVVSMVTVSYAMQGTKHMYNA